MYKCIVIDKTNLNPIRFVEMSYDQSAVVMFMCGKETWKTIPETDIQYLESDYYYFVRLEYYAELDTCMEYFAQSKENNNNE